MSWLLDTDVICQPAKKKGDPKVIAWLEAEQDRCYTSAVVREHFRSEGILASRAVEIPQQAADAWRVSGTARRA